MQNIKMAIRNLFRHKYRTFLTGATIIIITFLLVFGLSVSEGISNGLISNIISLNTGHITVNSSSNAQSNDTSIEPTNWDKQLLSNSDAIQDEIGKINGVEYSTKRVKFTGILTSKDKTSSGVFVGIEPGKEKDLLLDGIPLKEGTILPEERNKNYIYISTTTAELYNVKIGEELTIVGQNTEYEQNSMNFEVCGIFKKSAWKEYYSYIYLSDAQELASLGERVTQIKVMLSNRQEAVNIANTINESLGASYDIAARDWRTAGELLLGTVIIMEFSVFGLCIILFFLITSILVNNISMAVFERTNEIGMLMAMGMRSRGVFSLFMLETFFLSSIATMIGEILGIVASIVLNRVGIPAFVEVLRLSFGGDYTYPELKMSYIIVSFVVIVSMSLIVTIIPTKSAVKLNPVEAVNHVQ